MNWYFKKFSTNNHVNVYELETLPVRIPTHDQLERVSTLVRRIADDLGQSRRTIGAETLLTKTQVLEEIDQELYELYGLDETQVAQIEADF